MLDDRYYMRQSPLPGQRSVTVALLILNAAVFVLQLALDRYTRFPTDAYFALSATGLMQGRVWQLLTFQFMHAGWLHLLLNCWVIYVFGRELEANLGKKPFLVLYLASGVVGGLLQAAAGAMVPRIFGGATVGASAGAFGLVAAFATMYPERPLTLLLFFILPITMRAKFLLLFSGILAVLGILFPTDNIANAAHLGGMLFGVIFVRMAVYRSLDIPWPRRKQSAPRLVRVPSDKRGFWGARRVQDNEELPPEEFLSREVDPILDKISAHGIQSLTERERRILEAARTRMTKR